MFLPFRDPIVRRATVRARRAAAVLGAAAALSACGGSDGDDTVARTKATPCRYAIKGVTLRCGELDVPENYARPQGRRVTLPYVIVPSASGRTGGVPVVFLTGGPGYSAMADLGAVTQARDMYADRDLVVIEQRGNGDARPGLHCGDETPAACHARLRASGIDLSQYTTANTARDVIELRKALGHARWNLWGVSYGVSTAFAILRADPAGVNAAVLDSGSEPGDIAYADVQSNLDGFTRLFAACRDDAACAAAYPDLRTRFLAAIQDLNAEPLDLSGTGLDAALGLASLDGSALALLAAQLQQTPVFALVPSVIDAVARRQPQALGAALSAFQASRPPPVTGFDTALETAVGLTWSVYCGETPYSRLGREPIETIEVWPDAVVDALVPDYFKVCESGEWPVPRVPAAAVSLVKTEVRTLFLSGELDPITPPRQAEIASVGFTRRTLVTVPWETHAMVGRNACATALAARFLDRDLDAADRACLAAIPRPDFIP